MEQHDLAGYDTIHSNSHAVAKGVLTGPDQLHLSCVHSTIRYAWDLCHQYRCEASRPSSDCVCSLLAISTAAVVAIEMPVIIATEAKAKRALSTENCKSLYSCSSHATILARYSDRGAGRLWWIAHDFAGSAYVATGIFSPRPLRRLSTDPTFRLPKSSKRERIHISSPPRDAILALKKDPHNEN